MGFERNSLQGLAILLWATEPEAPHRMLTPFLLASTAAAMDTPVEMYFTARSVLLLQPELTKDLRTAANSRRTLFDVMEEAADLGVRFFACTEALHAHAIDEARTAHRPGYGGRGGLVACAERAADPAWRTLVF